MCVTKPVWIFWLQGKSLAGYDNLPELDELDGEIFNNPEAGMSIFWGIVAVLA